MIRGPARPVEHLALIVGSVLDRDRCRDRLHLSLVIAELGDIAIGEQIHRVAGRADLAVDLEATLRRSPVEGAEYAVEAPILLRRNGRLLRVSRRDQGERGETADQNCAEAPHQAFSIGLAAIADPLSLPPPNTGSLMLAGSGRGFSNQPSSGIRIQKNAK